MAIVNFNSFPSLGYSKNFRDQIELQWENSLTKTIWEAKKELKLLTN